MKIFIGTNFKNPAKVCMYTYTHANSDTLMKNTEVRCTELKIDVGM